MFKASPRSPAQSAPLSVYVVSLGCPKTRVDTERLLGSLGPVTPVDSPEAAQLVFVNTCGFIQPAVAESVRTLLEMAQARAARGGKRPLLVAAGCLVSRYGQELLAGLPEVDLWLPLDDQAAWPLRIRQALGRGGAAPAPGRTLSTPPGTAYLKVSEGCRHRCAFCTIPSIRGPLRSRPLPELLAEARELLAGGVRELVLVAQDTTAYGADLGLRHGLEQLVEELAGLPGLTWLRLMYLYPGGLTEQRLRFLAGLGRPFLPYFDVPLQHAHPDILRRMGRPFAADPRRVVERIRRHFPDAALRTSLIVGYPGEGRKEFQTLVRFVSEARFRHLGVFAYCQEAGTRAARLPEQVSQRSKSARRHRLMSLQAEISAAWLAEEVGGRQEVLVDAPSPEWPGLHVGRCWFQAPEVDGVTYVSGRGVRPGALVRGTVEQATAYDLSALV